ncbi:unnamed protein product [Rhizophagus irregularis]|nr:unnamed protein product [Rhizophagus irregularis]CAB5380796.1 unnamed protein product [Rhizophagus irregularis]
MELWTNTEIDSKNLSLDNDVSNEPKQLISLQNNLKSLEVYDNIWTNIIPALAKYFNTLTKLYFCNISDEDNDIPLSFMESFKNLQEIIFSFSADDDLESLERCSAIFLIGEFSYLLSRIRGVFIDQVSIIAVPALSTAVAARGAITYGSNVERTFVNGLMGKFFKVWLRVKKRKMENRLLYS